MKPESRGRLQKEERIRETEFKILKSPETRSELKEKVERLIEQVKERDIGAIVFLDKSARPLSWLFRYMWDPKKDGPRPEIKFLNIGQSTTTREGADKIVKFRNSYLGDYEESRLRGRIYDSQDEGKWLKVEDIPWAWQSGISEEINKIEKLEEVFGTSFDDKNVLIVDEIADSGKSQLATLGLLSAAFPKSKDIFSTHLYNRDLVRGHLGDLERIPWLHEPGMAGILEVPDDLLFSSTITEESLEKLRGAYDKARKEAWTDEMEHEIEEYKQMWAGSAEELRAKATQLRAEMEKLAAES